MPHYPSAAPRAIDLTQSRVDEVCSRVYELVALNDRQHNERRKIRNIMDGGPGAVAELLGGRIQDEGMRLPVANLMLVSADKLGTKLGRVPTLKTLARSDSDAAQRAAQHRLDIAQAYDAVSETHMQLPQAGRWLPGYGFVAWVIRHGRAPNGDPYPIRELRDPFETYPSEWGPSQQPEDIAFVRLSTKHRLLKLAPDPVTRERIANLYSDQRGPVYLERTFTSRYGNAGWENQTDVGIPVYEYINEEGSWWVLPDYRILLSFVPNPLSSGAPFQVAKRFAFNQLIGQYDHAIGLLSAMALLNLLLLISVEDAVMSETNIIGDLLNSDYRKGRNAVNRLAPGSSIQKINDNVPFQAFQTIRDLERQARIIMHHPVSEDSISPNSFVTGRGLQELSSSVDNEVREYQTVLADALTKLDAKCLEWDEKIYGDRSKDLTALLDDSSFDSYTPATHIKGRYRTRRVYGTMAGWDEATKIITGLQLLQAEAIDLDTFRENIDGLENLPKIEERIRSNKAEKFFMEGLAAAAQQGDPRALEALIQLLPDGAMKDTAEDVFAPEEMEAEAEAATEEDALAGLTGDEDVMTVLSRLTNTSRPVAGVQTVGRL